MMLSTHKIYRFMWSNFLYTKTANRSTEPDLLSTRTIVLRGRPSSQHTRATVSCGRTSSKTKPVNRCTGQMLHSTRDIVQWTELALDAIYRFTGSTIISKPWIYPLRMSGAPRMSMRMMIIMIPPSFSIFIHERCHHEIKPEVTLNLH